MPNRKGARNAYYFFVLEKMPELRRRGLAVTRVADAIPHCSDDWAVLTEDQKEKYAEMARQWKTKKSVAAEKSSSQVPAPLPTQTQNRAPANLTSPLRKRDQVMLETSFYFLNILSHGMLPPHCSQRFLPCEIGCIRYSLKEGIIADFHRFIDPGDATHRIPLSGFDLAATDRSVVLRELYTFIQPRWGTWPPVYCKKQKLVSSSRTGLLIRGPLTAVTLTDTSDDHFRVNWCLNHMAKEAGTVNHLELLSVEDLIVELYYQKLQKEPSKTWVCNILDASMWDYSANTRCQWHEENDVLICALATCKIIAYCISNSLANMYDIQLTASHLPQHEKDSQKTVGSKMVVLDAGHFQKMRIGSTGNARPPNQDQDTGDYPVGVKAMYEPTTRCGRGIARFFERFSKQSSS